MRLAKQINRRLATLRDELESRERIHYRAFRSLITRAVKPFGARVAFHRENMPPNDVGIGGCFMPQRKRVPIDVEVYVSKRRAMLCLTDELIDQTLFALFETISHELIHRDQYTHREPDARIMFYALDDGTPMNERQQYLAEVDEIDAYAHDIAIELIHRYPDTYMEKFRDTKNMTPVAWVCYAESFEGTQWSDIRNRLLKKVYQHITRIREYGEQYTCTHKSFR